MTWALAPARLISSFCNERARMSRTRARLVDSGFTPTTAIVGLPDDYGTIVRLNGEMIAKFDRDQRPGKQRLQGEVDAFRDSREARQVS